MHRAVVVVLCLVGVGLVVVVTVFLVRFGPFLWSDRRVVRRGLTTDPLVPKIIHQTWKSRGELRPYQQRSLQLAADHYSAYEHRFWSDADLEAFVAREFPQFHADTWTRLTPFIKKVDTARYMILFVYGGIYLDIDLMVELSLEPLLDVPGAAYVPAMNPWFLWGRNADAASPAVLASAPRNPFWLRMLTYIQEHHTPEYLEAHPREEVIQATGPIAVANVLQQVRKDGPPLVLLSESRMGLGAVKRLCHKYSFHENRHQETWRA